MPGLSAVSGFTRRCALLEGFSLHANTHLHANDRQGLERLCRYGAVDGSRDPMRFDGQVESRSPRGNSWWNLRPSLVR
jgi:hypothetical protein